LVQLDRNRSDLQQAGRGEKTWLFVMPWAHLEYTYRPCSYIREEEWVTCWEREGL
jgi:hypothetical protein